MSGGDDETSPENTVAVAGATFAALALAGLLVYVTLARARRGAAGDPVEPCPLAPPPPSRSAESVALGRQRFAECLGCEKSSTIRVVMADNDGMGHQASSAQLLRRLTQPGPEGYGYRGTIEIAYDKELEGKTLPKIKLLVPELDQAAGKLDGATLVLRPFGEDAPLDDVPLAFCGGIDETGSLAEAFKAETFIRIQPYRWHQPNDVQFRSESLAPLDLGRESVEGQEQLSELPTRLPAPAEPDWSSYEGGEFAEQARTVKWLTEQASSGKVDVGTLYGVQSDHARMGRPPGLLFDLATATLAAKPGGPRAVLVNTGEVKAYDLEATRGLLAGQPTIVEKANDDAIGPAKRAAYLAKLGASDRISIPEGRSVGALQEALGKPPEGPGVVVLQMGKLPPELFAHLLRASTLPSVFEGQNTANQARSMGKPFLHVQADYAKAKKAVYPPAPGHDGKPEAAEEAARQIPLALEERKGDPSAALGDLIAFIKDDDHAYAGYFAAIKPDEGSVDKIDLALGIVGLEVSC